MVNYKNSKIYKLVSNKNKNQIYVGTTTQKLTGRISWHRRKHQINDDTKIILIKNFPCETKEQLNAELYKQINEFQKNSLITIQELTPKIKEITENKLNKEELKCAFISDEEEKENKLFCPICKEYIHNQYYKKHEKGNTHRKKLNKL
jgi:hypothetical protein